MSVAYAVRLRNPAGESLSPSIPNASFRWLMTERAVGSLQMVIPGGQISRDWITRDTRLELWRRFDGGIPALIGGQWLINKFSITGNDEGIYLEAADFNALLDNRIIDYAASTPEVANAYTDKTDYADDMIKAFVRENIGSLATDTARRLANVSVAIDQSLAPSVSKQASRKNLLTTLQEIALDSAAQGTYLTWGWTFDDNAATFDTRITCWGANRGSTSGNTMIISRARGSLLEPSLTYDYTGERNVIKVGGMGEGAARVIGSASSTSATESPYSRKEYFAYGYNTDDVATLNAEANAILQEKRARLVLTGKIAETKTMRYDVDFGYGDIVVGEYAGHSIDCHINTVGAVVEGGIETALDIRLRGEETI